MTQQALSDRTEGVITKGHISMIESGAIADPGVTKIIAIARALDCPVGSLLDDAHGAQEILNETENPDSLKRERSQLLLQFWDELSEERQNTALGIMKMLASESAEQSTSRTRTDGRSAEGTRAAEENGASGPILHGVRTLTSDPSGGETASGGSGDSEP
jgi:transcriptional regulator with XRE-family HTH domain